MPKKAKELSALAVSKLKAEGRHAVGGADGLYLRIAGESRAWVLCVALGTRTNRSGKEVVRRLNMGLGPFPEVSLAEAREKARELRKQVGVLGKQGHAGASPPPPAPPPPVRAPKRTGERARWEAIHQAH
ncbi:MAG: DUF4102 domain-containing protein [Rhodocyclaceae bacterium]|nr:DUF4102 domain-containing protein [Rhodocyclaceae bacterium]